MFNRLIFNRIRGELSYPTHPQKPAESGTQPADLSGDGIGGPVIVIGFHYNVRNAILLRLFIFFAGSVRPDYELDAATSAKCVNIKW